jgi:hypothetical protein
MRLFHVSEEPDITRFVPRIPAREDLDPSKGLVWAINEHCLPSFFMPRKCPRVTYYAGDKTTEDDLARFFSSPCSYCLAMEHGWVEKMQKTTLYIYMSSTRQTFICKMHAQDTISASILNYPLRKCR